MSRQKKSPAERAQEAYDVAARIADRLEKKLVAAKATYEALQDEYRAAVARREHLAQHPDLPKQPTTTTGATPS